MLRYRWSRQRSLTWEFRLHRGPGSCPSDRVQAMLQFPSPTIPKQLWTFLGLTGCCRIWIPNCGLIAQPLYESLKGQNDSILLVWETPQKKVEATLKQNLTQAPALRLPDPEKAFQLYVHKNKGIDLGVLTQSLGPELQPVAYLSKRFDPTAQGWHPCLQNLAAIAVLIEDALKLYFGGKLTMFASHQVKRLLTGRGHLWMSDQRIFRYQVMLMENPSLTISSCEVLNPATRLPTRGLSPLSLLPRNFGPLDKTLRWIVRRTSDQSWGNLVHW